MRILLPALAALLFASSCATYDPCTKRWFEAQSDDLQRDFQRRNRLPLRRVNTLRDDLRDGVSGGMDAVFTGLALASARRDVETLIGDFRTSVVPEARGLARRCEIDGAFDIVVDAFLAEQGLDAELVRQLEMFGVFDASPEVMMALEPAKAY